jgi:hypothetical protein
VILSADTAKILAETDSNWQNYSGGTEVRSPELKWELYNFAGVNCFQVRFNVVVQYAVKHRTLPWISSIKVLFPQCDANFQWVLEGIAKIDQGSVINSGSENEMVPQAQLDVSFNAKAKFALGWQDLDRSASFTVNAKTGISLLSW